MGNTFKKSGTCFISIGKIEELMIENKLNLSEVQRQKKERKNDALGFLSNCWNTVLSNEQNNENSISAEIEASMKILGVETLKTNVPITGNQIYIDNNLNIWDAQHRIGWICDFLSNKVSLGYIGDSRLNGKTRSQIESLEAGKKLIESFKDLEFIVTIVDSSDREVIGKLFNDVNKSKPLSPLDRAKALCPSVEAVEIFDDFAEDEENQSILRHFYSKDPSYTFLKTIHFLLTGGDSSYSIMFNNLQKSLENNNYNYIDDVMNIFKKVSKLEEKSKVKVLNTFSVTGIKSINAFMRMCISECNGKNARAINNVLKTLYSYAEDYLIDRVKDKKSIYYNGKSVEISGHSTTYSATNKLAGIFYEIIKDNGGTF